MLDDLKSKLKGPIKFPSPPAVALEIIALASDADIDVAKVATAIGKDPGLAATIMRVANSPIYSKRRPSENLRQALVVLGLNTATSLALSFSLISTYRSSQGAGIDYPRYWRRAILGATAARRLGILQSAAEPETLFLAGLLQDIAILAIDRVQRDFYKPLPEQASHAAITAHEQALLGADHAALGGWLLRHWKLPEPLCLMVECSHEPLRTEPGTAVGLATRCVALGSECVDVLFSAEAPTDLDVLATRASLWLGLDGEALANFMAAVVEEIPTIEGLFDTRILAPEAANAILGRSRDLLVNAGPADGTRPTRTGAVPTRLFQRMTGGANPH